MLQLLFLPRSLLSIFFTLLRTFDVYLVVVLV